MSASRLYTPHFANLMTEKFGHKLVLEFEFELGGRRFLLPVKPKPEHPIALRFGMDVLVWLVEVLQAGTRLDIPLGPHSSYAAQNAAVARMVADGLSTEEIIRLARVHTRTVERHRRILRERGGDQRQGTFPI